MPAALKAVTERETPAFKKIKVQQHYITRAREKIKKGINVGANQRDSLADRAVSSLSSGSFFARALLAASYSVIPHTHEYASKIAVGSELSLLQLTPRRVRVSSTNTPIAMANTPIVVGGTTVIRTPAHRRAACSFPQNVLHRALKRVHACNYTGTRRSTNNSSGKEARGGGGSLLSSGGSGRGGV